MKLIFLYIISNEIKETFWANFSIQNEGYTGELPTSSGGFY
jgi:hypothetical protein